MFSGNGFDLMLKVKVQSIIVRTVHYSQVHSLCGSAVGVPFCFVMDVSEFVQFFVPEGERLIGKRHWLIGLSRCMRIGFASVCKVSGRIVAGMAEVLILLVADLVNALQESSVLGNDRAEREGMNSGTAGFLFF